jgi:hypothetical protein
VRVGATAGAVERVAVLVFYLVEMFALGAW